MKPKVASYYRKDNGSHFPFWQIGIGESLPSYIGDAFLFPCDDDSFEVNGDFDISYIQPWLIPNRRPTNFVYSFISDYKGYENVIKNWLTIIRPNYLFMLQQLPNELVEFGNTIGCKVELLPWFELSRIEYNGNRTINGFCGGRINPNHYPKRRAIHDYLLMKRYDGVVLSSSNSFGGYPIIGKSYRDTIEKTRYYFTGGIYDSFIPPKYFEAAKSGSCIVSHDMQFMRQCGFIHNQTCIIIESIDEIDQIISSDRYIEIGKNANRMVSERHLVHHRAKTILEKYEHNRI